MADQTTKSAVAAVGPEKTDRPSPVQPSPVQPNQVQPNPAPGLFAMFVKLEDRSCLVVGAGSLAESKIPGLLEAGARVGVVAPQANATVSGWARAGKITWKQRSFEPADLDGAFLVIAATGASAVNERVFREARDAACCAMRWMIPSVVISTTRRWCAEVLCSSRFQPEDLAPPWPSAYDVNSKSSSDQSMPHGSRNWAGRASSSWRAT